MENAYIFPIRRSIETRNTYVGICVYIGIDRTYAYYCVRRQLILSGRKLFCIKHIDKKTTALNSTVRLEIIRSRASGKGVCTRERLIARIKTTREWKRRLIADQVHDLSSPIVLRPGQNVSVYKYIYCYIRNTHLHFTRFLIDFSMTTILAVFRILYSRRDTRVQKKK